MITQTFILLQFICLKTYAVNYHAYISCVGKQEKIGLGPVFQPFMNSDQYRFQILLFHIDFPTLSWQNKVSKMCPKYLTFRQAWSSQHQIQINKSGKNKRCTQLSSLNPGCKYDFGRDPNSLIYMHGYFERRSTWSRGLVVSVSAYKTRGPGSNSGWAHIFSVFFSSCFFSILM